MVDVNGQLGTTPLRNVSQIEKVNQRLDQMPLLPLQVDNRQ
jgi:hypothetical protein